MIENNSNLTFRLANDTDLEAVLEIWKENIQKTYSIANAKLEPYEADLKSIFLSRNGYANFYSFWNISGHYKF